MTTVAQPPTDFPPLTLASCPVRPLLGLTTSASNVHRFCNLRLADKQRQLVLESNALVLAAKDVMAKARKAGTTVIEHPDQKPRLDSSFCVKVAELNPNLHIATDVSKFEPEEYAVLQQRLGYGYDDAEGHYVPIPGEELANRFILINALGKGSFGTVLRAIDLKTNEYCAVKISRTGAYFINQAKLEVDILLRVNGNEKLQNLAVRLRKYLMYKNHAVLVFNLLACNLYQLLRLSRFNGVSLDLVRKFSLQLIQILLELDRHTPKIIHLDLKPENILLNDQSRSGIRLIDFGSACYDVEGESKHKYVQSRFYRSPEVILGIPYSTPVDRWSLACIAYEMHTGVPLFPGKTEAESLARMCALLGPIPATMLGRADEKKLSMFFTRRTRPDRSIEYTLIQKPDPSFPTDLDVLLGVETNGPRGCRANQTGHTPTDYRKFVSFLMACLQYEPSERMALEHLMAHEYLEPLLVSIAKPASQPAPGHQDAPPSTAA